MTTVASQRTGFRVISGSCGGASRFPGAVEARREAARWAALIVLAITFFALVVGVGLLAGRMVDARSVVEPGISDVPAVVHDIHG